MHSLLLQHPVGHHPPAKETFERHLQEMCVTPDVATAVTKGTRAESAPSHAWSLLIGHASSVGKLATSQETVPTRPVSLATSRTWPLLTRNRQEVMDPPSWAASASLMLCPQVRTSAMESVDMVVALKDSNRFYVEAEEYRLQADGRKPSKHSTLEIVTSEARSREDAPSETACQVLSLALLTSRGQPRRPTGNPMEPLFF